MKSEDGPQIRPWSRAPLAHCHFPFLPSPVWPGAAIRVAAAPQVVYLSARLGFTLRDDTISCVMKAKRRLVQDQGGIRRGGSPYSLFVFITLTDYTSVHIWKLDPGRRCPRQPHTGPGMSPGVRTTRLVTRAPQQRRTRGPDSGSDDTETGP
jgi:hypothetical protein